MCLCVFVYVRGGGGGGSLNICPPSDRQATSPLVLMLIIQILARPQRMNPKPALVGRPSRLLYDNPR